ncbi:MAG TPA: DUF3373 domain-containing protein [Aquifex aeolicus]|uniref:DUF3373 domain-containing protein n=1 Tax=Aquifex aeolicus TaxID=63363 RepID=A0A7C5QKG6_AQUAO|nr:DUF3373 domain-containing protein [Aquifex aeolicus]
MKRTVLTGALLASSAIFAQPAGDIGQIREELEVIKDELRRLRLEIAMPQITEYKSYTGLGPAASKALINPRGVSIGGYGEIWFTNIPNQKPNTEVDLYRFIIYLGYAFTEKLKFNSEIEIEHAKIEAGEEDGGEVAIEFAFVDYRFNRLLGIRGGMVLVPLGITNEYHEPPTYMSVRQPYLEKSLFPFTWRENGVGAYGETDLLEYRVYLINGMKAEEEEYKPSSPLKKLAQSGAMAVSDQLAFTGRVDFKLPYNLKLGGATFISGVQNEQGEKLGTVSILSPHLWWQYAGFDVRFVGAYTTVSGADKITAELSPATCPSLPNTCNVFPEKMQGFYLQVAYNVLRFFDSDQELFLFGKLEDINAYKEVPAGYQKPAGGNYKIYNIGLTYRPHPLVALKADYVRKDVDEGNNSDIYSMAITWMF